MNTPSGLTLSGTKTYMIIMTVPSELWRLSFVYRWTTLNLLSLAGQPCWTALLDLLSQTGHLSKDISATNLTQHSLITRQLEWPDRWDDASPNLILPEHDWATWKSWRQQLEINVALPFFKRQAWQHLCSLTHWFSLESWQTLLGTTSLVKHLCTKVSSGLGPGGGGNNFK